MNKGKSVKGETQELIAYCRLYCRDCCGYKGAIPLQMGLNLANLQLL